MNQNCVIYCRVSSIGDRQSNERQVKDLEEYAKSKSLTVAGIYEEKISGAKKNAERQVLTDCLDYSATDGYMWTNRTTTTCTRPCGGPPRNSQFSILNSQF